MMDRVDHAHNWAHYGYHVFPLGDPGEFGKRPRIKGWLDRATRDEDEIDAWWLEWPEANIGVALQQYEYCLDADGPAQVQWVVNMLEGERTLTVATARGKHFYFDVPQGVRLRNRTYVCNQEGLEGKTQGKLVVGPGSVHASGEVYCVEDDVDPLMLPQEVLLAVGLYEATAASEEPSASELIQWEAARAVASDRARRYGMAVFQRSTRRLRRDLPVTEGWAMVFYVYAQRIGEHVARGAYSYGYAVRMLDEVFNLMNERQDPKGEAHVRRSIRRGLAAGARRVSL